MCDDSWISLLTVSSFIFSFLLLTGIGVLFFFILWLLYKEYEDPDKKTVTKNSLTLVECDYFRESLITEETNVWNWAFDRIFNILIQFLD